MVAAGDRRERPRRGSGSARPALRGARAAESGSSPSNVRAQARTGPRSTSTRAGPTSGCAASSRSKTGRNSGQNARQSSAVSRWMVPRIDAIRTTARSTSSVPRSDAANGSSRDQSAGVRIRRHLRLEPDEMVHRRQRVERRSRQQVLALQRRSVERPCGERVRHVLTLARASNVKNRQNQAPTGTRTVREGEAEACEAFAGRSVRSSRTTFA